MRPARLSLRRTTGVVALLLAASVLAGCSGDDEPKVARSVAPTPIASLNTGAMELARIDFCARLPRAAVKAALDGHVSGVRGQKWRDGSRVPVVPGAVASASPTPASPATPSPTATTAPQGTDVVREIGCRWTSADGWSAAAWMFATPTTLQAAQTVIVDNRGRKNCRASPGPAFGTPSQRLDCTLPDGSRRARVAGLFGDTWLTCEVQGPTAAGQGTAEATTEATALRTRGDAWCVQVANALNTVG